MLPLTRLFNGSVSIGCEHMAHLDTAPMYIQDTLPCKFTVQHNSGKCIFNHMADVFTLSLYYHAQFDKCRECWLAYLLFYVKDSYVCVCTYKHQKPLDFDYCLARAAIHCQSEYCHWHHHYIHIHHAFANVCSI